jgi:hypothetical protein
LVAPPTSDAARQSDAIVDLCDTIAALAHPSGPGGGKSIPIGPSALFSTSNALTWKSTSIAIDEVVFRDVTHGQGVWVAVGGVALGAAGAIAIADRADAPTWRQVFASDEWAFTSIAFGNGTFVAVSKFGLAVSRDGEHWSWANVPQPSRPSQLEDVAFGNGRFVVAGVGASFSSADGQTWETIACGDPHRCDPSALQQVTFVAGKFYLFGGSGGLESSDGRTLERVPVTLAAAAIGGRLLSAALDPEEAWVRAGQTDQLTQIFLSEDDGHSWFPRPVTRAESADCTVDRCVVIPAGILVARSQ